MEVLTAGTRRPSLHSRPWATTSQPITSTVQPRMSREAPSSIRTSSADIVSAQFQLFRIRFRVSIIANVVPNTHHQLTQPRALKVFCRCECLTRRRLKAILIYFCMFGLWRN